MKKCKDCNREIDKYDIACEYCGKVEKEREKSEIETSPEEERPEKE